MLSLLLILLLISQDSSVGNVARYGLGDPMIESNWRRVFPHSSTHELDATQDPVQWNWGLLIRG